MYRSPSVRRICQSTIAFVVVTAMACGSDDTGNDAGLTPVSVVLTFDDGPVDAEVARDPAPTQPFAMLLAPLDQILAELADRQVEAVFYIEGPWTEDAARKLAPVHRMGLERIRAAGHRIGYHAFNHEPSMWQFSDDEAAIRTDLDRLQTFLGDTIGLDSVTPVLRPPFGGPGKPGEHARAWAEEHGITYRAFTIDTVDWTSNATADPSLVLPVQCESARLDYVYGRIESRIEDVMTASSGPQPEGFDLLFHVNAFTGRNIEGLLDATENAFERLGFVPVFDVTDTYLQSDDGTVDLTFLSDLGRTGACPRGS
jgi:peptidoglycan/xylan/chitin deacetylase (PgdA/CDA1 family)